MSGTNFSKGLSVYGVPVMPGTNGDLTSGNVFWVDSNDPDGSDNPEAGKFNTPFSTTDYAVGQTTANNGDVIMVKEGHNETIVSATSLVVDVAGVSIVGLGNGRNRPTYDFDDTAGSIEMDAANTRLSNVVLNASVSAVVVGVNVDANDVTLDNLEFTFEDTGDDFVTTVDIDAVSRATVRNSRFRAESGAAGAAVAIRLDTSHFAEIIDNHFTGQYSDSVIVGEGAAGTDILIANNSMYNADTGDANGIDLNVAFTGVISDNRIATLYATTVDNLLDPGSCLCTENYVVNAINETGIVAPATPSA